MDLLDGLKSLKEEEVDVALEQFITLVSLLLFYITIILNLWFKNKIFQNEQSFTFPSLNDPTIQSEIWTLLINLVRQPDCWKSHLKCLKILKILSRDKQYLDEIINPNIIEVLVASSDVNASLQIDLSLQYEGVNLRSLKS